MVCGSDGKGFVMGDAELFAGLEIQVGGEALPSRQGRGAGPQIPNPFLDAVLHSFEDMRDGGKPEECVRTIFVPVKGEKLSYRTQKIVRRDKNRNVLDSREVLWATSDNINKAVSLLRQAADKQGLGVRIVVDYTGQPGMPDDPAAADGVVRHGLVPQASGPNKGTVRIRFLGQQRKQNKAKQPAAVTVAA